MRRANRSQLQEAVQELLTSVTSGQKSSEYLASLDQDGSWVKTSEGYSLFPMDESLVPFLQTWPTWGTALDGVATELTKPVERPIAEIGSSSSDTWRTPSAGDVEGGIMEMRPNCAGKYKLRDHAANWPTPDAGAINDGESPESFHARRMKLKELKKNGNGAGTPLTIMSVQWPTPKAWDERRESVSPAELLRDSPDLKVVASTFRPDQQTSTHGEKSCETGPISPPPSPQKKRLNYRFVQWLMGFPEGWLSVCWAMLLSLSRSTPY